MKSTRKNAGMALVFVLVLVVLATMQMALFTQASRALQLDTDRAVSYANERDLRASAVAWVRVHGDAERPAAALDTTALGIRQSALTMSMGLDGATEIAITYRCPALRRVVHIHPDGSRSVESDQ